MWALSWLESEKRESQFGISHSYGRSPAGGMAAITGRSSDFRVLDFVESAFLQTAIV